MSHNVEQSKWSFLNNIGRKILLKTKKNTKIRTGKIDLPVLLAAQDEIQWVSNLEEKLIKFELFFVTFIPSCIMGGINYIYDTQQVIKAEA